MNLPKYNDIFYLNFSNSARNQGAPTPSEGFLDQIHVSDTYVSPVGGTSFSWFGGKKFKAKVFLTF